MAHSQSTFFYPPASAAAIIVIDADRYLLVRKDEECWGLVAAPVNALADPQHTLAIALGQIMDGAAPTALRPYSKILMPPPAPGGVGLLRHLFILPISIRETAAFYLRLGDAMTIVERTAIAKTPNVDPLDDLALRHHAAQPRGL